MILSIFTHHSWRSSRSLMVLKDLFLHLNLCIKTSELYSKYSKVGDNHCITGCTAVFWSLLNSWTRAEPLLVQAQLHSQCLHQNTSSYTPHHLFTQSTHSGRPTSKSCLFDLSLGYSARSDHFLLILLISQNKFLYHLGINSLAPHQGRINVFS